MSTLAAAPERILVRATNWVGDAIITTPFFRALRKNFPRAEQTVVCRPHVAGVLEGNPHIDHLAVWRGRGLSDTRTFGRKLARSGFDLSFTLANSFSAAMLLWAAKARERVGFAAQLRSPLLTRPIKAPRWLYGVHQVNWYLYLLKDVCDDFEGVRRLDLALAPGHRAEAASFLDGWLEPGEPLAAFAHGAVNSDAKRWPPEFFAELAEELALRQGWRVVFTGAPAEGPLADEIVAKSPALAKSGRARNACGKLSLKGSAALLERAAHFFANDSGGMHLASAVGTPTTALFGPTEWLATAPYSASAKVLRDATVECAPCMLRQCPIDHRCMRALDPKRVLADFEARGGVDCPRGAAAAEIA